MFKGYQMTKTTRAMVAERAGVSLPMVSYVVNNSRPVSEKTKKKVLQAIEELNYIPDAAAQSMVLKRSKSFMIVSNNVINPMYGEIILEFEKAAFSFGYSTLICGGFLELKKYVPSIVAKRVDGLYFASVPDKVKQSDIDYLIENKVKICCGNYLLPREKRVNRLDIDYEDGMRQVVEYLTRLGHKKIIYANGFSENYELDVRCNAFIRYALGGEKQNDRIFYGDGPGKMNDAEGYKLGKKILASGVKFDACVCVSDMFAYGVMRAFKEGGVRIPEDVSVVGFENLMISDIVSPRLTSVSFDRVEFSSTLVRQLINSVETGTISEKMIPVEICERESVCDRTQK